jgi:hypothetical protein
MGHSHNPASSEGYGFGVLTRSTWTSARPEAVTLPLEVRRDGYLKGQPKGICENALPRLDGYAGNVYIDVTLPIPNRGWPNDSSFPSLFHDSG